MVDNTTGTGEGVVVVLPYVGVTAHSAKYKNKTFSKKYLQIKFSFLEDYFVRYTKVA